MALLSTTVLSAPIDTAIEVEEVPLRRARPCCREQLRRSLAVQTEGRKALEAMRAEVERLTSETEAWVQARRYQEDAEELEMEARKGRSPEKKDDEPIPKTEPGATEPTDYLSRFMRAFPRSR